MTGATLATLELRWDGWASKLYRGSTMFRSAGIPRAKLQGEGYLDAHVLEQLSEAVMPSNMEIAEAVGASEYGGTGPRLKGASALPARAGPSSSR